MKKFSLLILLTISIFFISCRTPHEVVWDMMVLPFSGINKDSISNIDRYLPSCKTAQYSINLSYVDSLSLSDNYILSYGTAEQGHFSVLQTRMYDRQGYFAGSYEFCNGNAKYLDIYKTVPISANISHHEIFNHHISLQNDVNFLIADEAEKEVLLSNTSQYDYTIVTIWTPFAGYYSKRHLRQLKRYLNKYGNEYDFRIIYVRLPLKVQM